MTDEQTQVRRVLEQEVEIPPRVREEILAGGASWVGPLLEMLRDEEGGYARVHAATLLTALKAPEAIGPMFDLLLRTEPGQPLYAAVLQGLERMGPAVAPEGLERLAREKDEAARISLLAVLARSGARDERLIEALLEQLEEEPTLGALNLARYGDARALEPLARALEVCPPLSEESVDLFASQVLVELAAAIESLGGTFAESQREKVARARSMRRTIAGMLQRLTEDLALFPGLLALELEPDEPCWCGSGEQYARCHQERDQAARQDS
jgi:hypothetical protein